MYDKKTGAFGIIPLCVYTWDRVRIFLTTSLHSSLLVTTVYSTVKINMLRHLREKTVIDYLIHLPLSKFTFSEYKNIHPETVQLYVWINVW